MLLRAGYITEYTPGERTITALLRVPNRVPLPGLELTCPRGTLLDRHLPISCADNEASLHTTTRF